MQFGREPLGSLHDKKLDPASENRLGVLMLSKAYGRSVSFLMLPKQLLRIVIVEP